jgi:hypothetical protein
MWTTHFDLLCVSHLTILFVARTSRSGLRQWGIRAQPLLRRLSALASENVTALPSRPKIVKG